MMIKQLVTVVEQICSQMGYSFCCGTQKQINSTVKKLPTAWMEFPAISKIVGREKGTITYEVSLYLMKQADLKNAIDQNVELEDHAISIYNELAKNQIVRAVDDLETSFEYMKFPPLGEVSIHLEFEISLDFYSNYNLYD